MSTHANTPIPAPIPAFAPLLSPPALVSAMPLISAPLLSVGAAVALAHAVVPL
jgi:hypothetical protein